MTPTQVQCQGGYVACGSNCVSLTTDYNNCGGCGRACSAGQYCNAGACTSFGGTACAGPNLQMCQNACINISADVNNCGGCGRACGGNAYCQNGGCIAAPVSCLAGQTACGATCVNATIDPRNCGACGRTCAADQSCQNGACSAIGGGAGCPNDAWCGAARICVLGSCQNGCRDSSTCGSGQTCASGICVLTGMGCAGGLAMCGGSCANLQTDVANCGACGRTCAAGQACNAGACQIAGGGCLVSMEVTCGVGICQRRIQSCIGGVVQACVPGSPAVGEACNGLDDNCNGVVDDGCVGGALPGSVTLRVEIDANYFNALRNASLNLAAGSVCPGGWTIIVYSSVGYAHESTPGFYFQESLPANWIGYSDVSIACGLHGPSPWYATWPAGLQNQAANLGGITVLRIDGRDLHGGPARICRSNGYYRPVVPWGGVGGGNENRCPM